MKVHNRINQQRKNGFTLIGIVISIGMVAVIGLSLATFSASTTAYFSKMDQHTRINESVEEIRSLLSNPFQCTKNFFNTSFIPAASSETPITKISQFDDSTSAFNEVLRKNSNNRGVSITDIKIISGNTILGSQINAATLQITFTSTANNNTVDRNIPIYILQKANKITSCWTKAPDSNVIGEQICSLGVGETYDPVTKTCVAVAATWYIGTSTEASCPSDKTMIKSKKRNKCGYQVSSTWVDPQPSASFTMTNGASSTKTRSPVRFNIDTDSNTCYCSWATNISDADISTFKCRVLCQ